MPIQRTWPDMKRGSQAARQHTQPGRQGGLQSSQAEQPGRASKGRSSVYFGNSSKGGYAQAMLCPGDAHALHT